MKAMYGINFWIKEKTLVFHRGWRQPNLLNGEEHYLEAPRVEQTLPGFYVQVQSLIEVTD